MATTKRPGGPLTIRVFYPDPERLWLACITGEESPIMQQLLGAYFLHPSAGEVDELRFSLKSSGELQAVEEYLRGFQVVHTRARE